MAVGTRTDTKSVAQELREPELPQVMRGFKVEPTQALLQRAAEELEKITAERDGLRRELEAARAAKPADEDAPDAETIGRALVTATSMSDQLLASAKEKAEHLIAEAEAEAERLLAAAATTADEVEREIAGRRDRLERDFAALKKDAVDQREQLKAERDQMLDRVRSEAERVLGETSTEVDRLREEADRLGEFLEAQKRAVASIARTALEQLDHLTTGAGADGQEVGETDGLVADLHPADARSAPTTAPGHDAHPAA